MFQRACRHTQEEEEGVPLFFVCVLGATGVGKTSICRALCGERILRKYNFVVQEEYLINVVQLPPDESVVCRIRLIDTTRQTGCAGTLLWPLRTTDGVIYVFDASSIESTKNIIDGIKGEVDKYCDRNCVPCLAAINKMDKPAEALMVNQDAVIQTKTVQHWCQVFLVSAVDCSGVVELFSVLVEQMLARKTNRSESSSLDCVQSSCSSTSSSVAPLFSFKKMSVDEAAAAFARRECDATPTKEKTQGKVTLATHFSSEDGGGCLLM